MLFNLLLQAEISSPVMHELEAEYNYNNILYLVSTLAKCEATTFAIVISLSLLAIQLSSTSYSPRVITIIKNDFYFWALIFLYFGSITFTISILKFENFMQNENLISISYLLAILCYVALIPYFLHILQLLQPSKIIILLSKKLDKKVANISEPGCDMDAIQPITDIIIRSIIKMEQSTVVVGLNSISDQLLSLITIYNFSRKEENNIANLILYHFVSIIDVAANSKDNHAIKLIIKKLEQIGLNASKRKFQRIGKNVIILLKYAGEKLLIQNESDISLISIRYIGNIGSDAIKNNLDEAAFNAVEALGEMGRKAVLKEATGNAAYQAVNSLRQVGIKSTPSREMLGTTKHIADSLSLIGIQAIKNNIEGIAPQAIYSLKVIEKVAIKNGIGEIKMDLARSIGSIRNAATAKKGLEELEKKCA